LYRQIHPKECLKQAWNKKPDQAVNVMKFIDFFNTVSSWVSTVILQTQDIKIRTELIKRFITVGVKCIEYHNFNGCQEMCGGLGGSGVGRLKKTWAKVKKKHAKLFEHFVQCQRLMNADSNFRLYRQTVAKVNPPCIPYLGLYFKDLTFIEDGNPDFLSTKCKRNDIINFEKMEMIAAVIKQIRMYQQAPYLFHRVDAVATFMEGLGTTQTLSDKEGYKLSLELEPRENEVQHT